MSEPLTPADLGRFIEEHGIDAAIVSMHVETPTVPAAAAALAVEPAQIIKTLVFLVKDEPVVVIASGDTMVDRRPVAGMYGVGKKQVRLADAETALRVTGYEVGGVPPFGHVSAVPVLLDERIGGWDVVYGGAGDDWTLLRITPAELARVTQGEWVSLVSTRAQNCPCIDPAYPVNSTYPFPLTGSPFAVPDARTAPSQ